MQQGNNNISKTHLPSLSKIFSPIVLNNLIKDNYSSYLSELFQNIDILKNIDQNITLGKFFEYIFNLLKKHYRNEYIYKNSIVENILIKKHDLETTQMITEFRVGKSKADIVLLNGTSAVYEIKTEYDTLNRLDDQISSYETAFDLIYVVVPESYLGEMHSKLPDKVGIILYSDQHFLTEIRNAKNNIENIKHEVLFKSLRKPEYLKIIKDNFGFIPDVPNTRIFDECQTLFHQIPITKLQFDFISILKLRNNSKALNNYLRNAPHSTFAYAVSVGEKPHLINKLNDLLNRQMSFFLHQHT